MLLACLQWSMLFQAVTVDVHGLADGLKALVELGLAQAAGIALLHHIVCAIAWVH